MANFKELLYDTDWFTIFQLNKWYEVNTPVLAERFKTNTYKESLKLVLSFY